MNDNEHGQAHAHVHAKANVTFNAEAAKAQNETIERRMDARIAYYILFEAISPTFKQQLSNSERTWYEHSPARQASQEHGF
jgi:hypothetical protein